MSERMTLGRLRGVMAERVHEPWKVTQPAHDPQAYDVSTASGGLVTKLPWGRKDNAELIAAAHNALPALIECAEALHGLVYVQDDWAWHKARVALAKLEAQP